MDSTLAAHATPTSLLPLSSLLPPPLPAQARDAARASQVPALYGRLAADTSPMLPAATASSGSAPEILPDVGCPIRTMPSDVLHAIVIKLRKADSTLHGIREVERLRASSRQLHQRIPRPIPEGLLGAVEFNDMAALKQLLAAPGHASADLAQALQQMGQLVRYSHPELDTVEFSPLLAAIKLGHVEMVKLLVEAGDLHELTVGWKEEALLFAVNLDANEAAAVLVAAGALVNHLDPGGVPVLASAVGRGNAAMVRLLTQAGAEADKVFVFTITSLSLAAKLGKAEVIPALLDGGAAVDRRAADGRTALLDALIKGHDAAADALRNGGAKDYPAFARAAQMPLIKGFIRLHAGLPMLMLAAVAGDAHLVKDLLLNGAAVNDFVCLEDEPISALFLAAMYGHATVIPILLEAGAALTAPGEQGDSALHYAVASNNAEVVRMLLQAGAAIDGVDPRDRTALANAAMHGHHDVVACLLQAGAAVDAIAYFETRTALMMAAAHGHLAIVEALMQHGADVNREDRDRQTSLIFAAKEGYVATAKALLQGGANRDHKDRNNMTSLDHAVKEGHRDMADLLRAWQ